MPITKPCERCGNTFSSYLSWKRKYCSNYCSNHGIQKNTGKTHFKKGQEPWNKGEGYINVQGYRVITYKGKQVFEHHKNWCLANGMLYIPKGCVVHHINQKKADNRPENLALLPKEYHDSLHQTLKNNNPYWKGKDNGVTITQ